MSASFFSSVARSRIRAHFSGIFAELFQTGLIILHDKFLPEIERTPDACISPKVIFCG